MTDDSMGSVSPPLSPSGIELFRQEAPQDTLLDTIPNLLFAVETATRLLGEKHRRLVEAADLTGLFKTVQHHLSKIPLAGRKEQHHDLSETGELFSSAVGYLEDVCREMGLILASPESIKASLERSTELTATWLPLICVLFYSSTVLLLRPHDLEDERERQFQHVFLQKFLPQLTRLWPVLFEQDLSIIQTGSYSDWLAKEWRLLCLVLRREQQAIDGEAAGRAVEIVARMLKAYFPWSSEQVIASTRFERQRIDLRQEGDFVILLQTCLDHEDASIRKQALFVLKQTVKFSSHCLILQAELSVGNRLFLWKPQDREAWGLLWQKFFMLYESIHENHPHIIEPLIPLFRWLLLGQDEKEEEEEGKAIQLDLSWWELLIRRGLANDSIAIRRCILEAILQLDIANLPRLQQDGDFLFGFLLEALDNTYLYSTTDAPDAAHSAFGLKVASFFASYIDSKDSQKGERIIDFLKHIHLSIRSVSPAVFLLQALLVIRKEAILDVEGVELLKKFSRNHVLFHNIKARRLARWQLLHIFLNLADPQQLSFEVVSAALTEFLRELGDSFHIESHEFRDVSAWLQGSFSEGYLDENISLAVQQYFAHHTELTIKRLEERAQIVAKMLVFTLSRPGGFSQCIRPLFQQMAILATVGLDRSYLVAAVLLFTSVNTEILQASRGEVHLLSDLDADGRIFEWITAIEALLLGDPQNSLTDLDEVCVLVNGMRLFLDKATCNPGMLIKYLDILLYKMVDCVDSFERLRVEEAAETFALQLLKLVAFELMNMSFARLERIGNFHLGFVQQRTLQQVFSCELDKPPALLDSQCDQWNELVLMFASAKWNLIATMSRFASRSPEMHHLFEINSIFEMCLLALEDAKYKSILAIFGCMRVLASLDHDHISVNLISESINLARTIFDEAANTPSWFYLYVEAFIDYLFQPTMLKRDDIGGGMDSPIAMALDYLLHVVGSKRRAVVTRSAKNLCAFWRTHEGAPSRQALMPFMPELLAYGPIREEREERLLQTLAASNVGEEGEERLFEKINSGSDYLVRVHTNSVLLSLDPSSQQDRLFALDLFDSLLDLAMTKGKGPSMKTGGHAHGK